MKNHEGMTDGQINWKVHHIVSKGAPSCIKDYCNDVSVAWPIIVGNHISLELDEGCLAEAYVLASYVNSELADKINCVDENPLRAAMICFLKMKDADVSE